MIIKTIYNVFFETGVVTVCNYQIILPFFQRQSPIYYNFFSRRCLKIVKQQGNCKCFPSSCDDDLMAFSYFYDVA